MDIVKFKSNDLSQEQIIDTRNPIDTIFQMSNRCNYGSIFKSYQHFKENKDNVKKFEREVTIFIPHIQEDREYKFFILTDNIEVFDNEIHKLLTYKNTLYDDGIYEHFNLYKKVRDTEYFDLFIDIESADLHNSHKYFLAFSLQKENIEQLDLTMRLGFNEDELNTKDIVETSLGEATVIGKKENGSITLKLNSGKKKFNLYPSFIYKK